MSPAAHTGLRNALLFASAWLYLGFFSQAIVRLVTRRGDGQ